MNRICYFTFSLFLLGCSRQSGAKLSSEKIPKIVPSPLPQPAPKASAEVQAHFALQNPTLEHFASCDELQHSVHTVLEAEVERARIEHESWKQYYSENGGYEAYGTMANAKTVEDNVAVSAVAAPTENGTNVQERGIDEADFVKLGMSQIYVARKGEIDVFDRATFVHVGSLKLDSSSRADLFVDAKHLMAIQNDEAVGCDVYLGNCGANTQTSRVTVFDLKEQGVPTVARSFQLDGSYADARYKDGHLFVVLKDELNVVRPIYIGNAYAGGDFGATLSESPVVIPDGGEAFCSSIVKPMLLDEDFSLTHVVSIDPSSDALVGDLRVFGGGDELYMANGGVYLSKTNYVFPYYSAPQKLPDGSWSWTYQDFPENVIVTKLAFDSNSGAIDAAAVGQVAGRVKDQWAFKELDDQGHLAVATTTGYNWSYGEQVTEQNHLTVLEPNEHELAAVGSVSGFGLNEDIRSIRYLGKKAYVVTFKKTDPLFVIDLSDATNPKMEGELQVPGFSTYLHPISETRLLGLGFDAVDEGSFAWFQGLQFSLFDISHPENMSRLDNAKLGSRGSFSEATANHHAFYFDNENSIAAFPVTEFSRNDGAGPWDYGTHLDFSGAAFFKVFDDHLEVLSKVSHSDVENCQSSGQWWQSQGEGNDIARVFQVDSSVVTLSRFALRAHDRVNPGVVKSTFVFSNESCER